MKALAFLLLKFVAVTVPLTWLWFEGGRVFYRDLLQFLLDPIYDAMGTRRRFGGPVGPRLVSIVPFLALVLVTPELGWRARLKGAAIGSAILVVFHCFLLFVVDAAHAVYGAGTRSVATMFPFLIFADGLPLLIWLVIARNFLRKVIPGLREEPAEAPTGDPE